MSILDSITVKDAQRLLQVLHKSHDSIAENVKSYPVIIKTKEADRTWDNPNGWRFVFESMDFFYELTGKLAAKANKHPSGYRK